MSQLTFQFVEWVVVFATFQGKVRRCFFHRARKNCDPFCISMQNGGKSRAIMVHFSCARARKNYTPYGHPGKARLFRPKRRCGPRGGAGPTGTRVK